MAANAASTGDERAGSGARRGGGGTQHSVAIDPGLAPAVAEPTTCDLILLATELNWAMVHGKPGPTHFELPSHSPQLGMRQRPTWEMHDLPARKPNTGAIHNDFGHYGSTIQQGMTCDKYFLTAVCDDVLYHQKA